MTELQKWKIGISITLIGIVISLFVPEVRSFLGIDKKSNIKDIELAADRYFERGDYDNAIAKYKEIDPISDLVFIKLEDAKNCQEWKNKADEYYQYKEYKKAKIEYEKIRDLNSKDIYVKEKIILCNEELQKQYEAEVRKKVDTEARLAAKKTQQQAADTLKVECQVLMDFR